MDLANRGESLVELWQSRRWRYLLAVIAALPRDSCFVEALSTDEELARAAVDAGAGERVTRLRTYGAEVELLAAIFDRLGTLAVVLISANGGKAPAIEPWPRPRLASDRVTADRSRERHQRLVARLLPKGAQ